VRVDKVANAIEKLERAIAELKAEELSEETKQGSLQLLEEITKQASSPNGEKVVLKQLGNGLWEAIKNVQSLTSIVSYAWPIIQGLWT